MSNQKLYRYSFAEIAHAAFNVAMIEKLKKVITCYLHIILLKIQGSEKTNICIFALCRA
jgi:hypothetical protein